MPSDTDGDFPEWLQASMGEFLPPELLEKYGEEYTTMPNGNAWWVPEENLQPTCAVLRAQGWDLREARDLPFH